MEVTTGCASGTLLVTMQDADAFAALYDREARAVLVFIARRTFDPEVALDLTAETFAQAFRGRRSFRGESVLEERAWLFTIARRQVGRYFRRGAIEKRALTTLGASLPEVHEDDRREIELAADLSGMRGTLGSALEELSVGQRDALRLRVVEERPYPEVADALGISEQSARARVSRGLRALAAAMDAGPVKEGA